MQYSQNSKISKYLVNASQGNIENIFFSKTICHTHNLHIFGHILYASTIKQKWLSIIAQMAQNLHTVSGEGATDEDGTESVIEGEGAIEP